MPDDENAVAGGPPFQMKINFLRGTVSSASEILGSLDVREMPDQAVTVGTVTESEEAKSILADVEIELSDFDTAFLDNLEVVTHSDFRMRVVGISGQPRVHIVVTDVETGKTIFDGIEPDDGLGWGDVRTLEQAFTAVWQKAFGVDFDDT